MTQATGHGCSADTMPVSIDAPSSARLASAIVQRNWLAVTGGFAVTAIALGGVTISSYEQTRRLGQLEGICVALDMVMAHGLMDEPRRALVTRTLASPTNPYFDRIAPRHTEITRQCRKVATERWSWK